MKIVRSTAAAAAAENEPLKVHLTFHSWDLIFTEPPRAAAQADRPQHRDLGGGPRGGEEPESGRTSQTFGELSTFGGRPDYLQKLKVPEGDEKMIDY